MNKEEFSLSHHELRLEVELSRRTGKAFQDFFEQIMQKADSSFVMIKPMGKVGDWKADGYSLSTATVYQCYAPEELTGTMAADKAREDFDGARNYWKEKMRRWVFVWSSKGALPPQVAAVLADLKAKHPALTIDHIGREGLLAPSGVEGSDRRESKGLLSDTPASQRSFYLSLLLSSPCVLFCATAQRQHLSFHSLAHSFHRHGGVYHHSSSPKSSLVSLLSRTSRGCATPLQSTRCIQGDE
jgi:hypothetical protein